MRTMLILSFASLASLAIGCDSAPQDGALLSNESADELCKTSQAVTGYGNLCTNGSWRTAARLESQTGHAMSPAVGGDDNGRFVAAWVQENADHRQQLWTNRYTPGSGWSTPALIAGPGVPEGFKLAVRRNGDALLVWEQADATSTVYKLWFASFSPSTGWSTPQLISPTHTIPDWGNLDLAVDGQGRALLAWTGALTPSGYERALHWSRYTPGTGWTAPATVAGETAWRPVVALSSGGDGLLLWDHAVNGNDQGQLKAARFAPASGLGSATPLETATGALYEYDAEMDASGNALVVMMQTPASGWPNADLFGRRLTGGTWGALESLESTTQVIGAFALGSDGAGTYVLAYGQAPASDLGRGTTYVRTSRNGAWNNPVSIGNGYPDVIGVDINRNAMLLGATTDGQSGWRNLWAARYCAGQNRWEGSTYLEDVNRWTGKSALGLDGTGNAVALWPQSEDPAQGMPASIWQRLFD